MKNPSKYQQDIFNAVITTNSSIAVKAGPGAGKTSTIVEASKMIKYGKSAIFVAFNKSIVKELKEKLPLGVDCMTMHSLGTKCIFNHYPGEKKIKDDKQIQFIIPFYEDRNPREKWVKIYQVDRIMKLARATMSEPSIESIERLCDVYALDIEEDEIKVAVKALKKLYNYNDDVDRYNITIDFQDMIEKCVRNKEIKMPQYDYVFIDEAQDLSKLDQLFVNRLVKRPFGRKIVVGDPKQCQPEGTKVLMSDGSEKNIEDLKVGDRVVSYNHYTNTNSAGFIGCHVGNLLTTKRKHDPVILDIAKRQYEGDMVKIESKGYTSRYTPNHRCIAKFNDKQGFAVYLMRKGNWFRVGITPLWNVGYKEFGPSQRFKQEKADALWILSVFKTRNEAYCYEQYVSVRYGIPQMIFHLSQKRATITQRTINEFYKSFGGMLFSNGNATLRAHLLDPLLPLLERTIKRRIATKGVFELYACNIPSLYQYLRVGHYDINNKRKCDRKRYTRMPIFHPITQCLTYFYKGYVFSLDVSKKTYVADNILTHNSIYHFRGSDPTSFESFVNEPNTIQLPLSISYRCAKNIVGLAKEVYDDIEPYENNEDGVVRNGRIEEIQEGDMVLCRNTRPLVSVYLQLLEQEKKAIIVGKDTEKGLLSILTHFESGDSTEVALPRLQGILDKIHENLKARGIVNPTTHPRYVQAQEKVEILKLIFRLKSTIFEVEKFIETVFDEDREGIRLMTIHKSKGLENERVFVIETFDRQPLIPSKYAITPDQLRQERNLRFVAYTRARKELVKLFL